MRGRVTAGVGGIIATSEKVATTRFLEGRDELGEVANTIAFLASPAASGAYAALTATSFRGLSAVPYTHPTLPTNREV